MPPPSVRPATVVADPNGYVAALKSPHVAPPSARAVADAGSTRMPRIRDRSITTPPSHVPKPGTLCPPPRTARSSPLSRARFTAAMTSPTFAARTIIAGLRSIIAL